MREFGRHAYRSFLLALVSLLLFSGCSLVPRVNALLPGNRAFIVHWPAKPGSNQLRLAVKDNIDMEGVVTTAGSAYFAKTRPPAKKDAPCLAIARQRNVHIVGKANLTEFAVAPSGLNDYFGTPRNPFNLMRSLIPGGSSCGSAVAVASGMADVALGTDTAGSIRVPAACCGIVGLKTTHGLVSVDGVFPIEPAHLDTVGPMGKDIASTAKGMDLLQNGFAEKYAAAQAAYPSAKNIRVGRLNLKGTDPKIDAALDRALANAGFQVVPLNDDLREKWEQAKRDGNAIAAAGAWISDKNFRHADGVTARTKAAIFAGRISYPKRYREALARRAEWQKTLEKVFTKVDFIALPTLQTTPLPIPRVLKVSVLEARMLILQNTVAVNFAGNPALAMPVPLHYLSLGGHRALTMRVPFYYASVPVTSLQLIGPPLSEAELLNAGRLVETGIRKAEPLWSQLINFPDKLLESVVAFPRRHSN
jgi:Asp-tRNA(Asn)/Glu-tRNA(Gln) amidotransferase A subunit family amidase